MEERKIWTIAYRKRTGPWFQRIDMNLTWHQAREVAAQVSEFRPELEVWYTTTRAYDNANPTEDSWNILLDNGRRLRIRDTGKPIDGIVVPDAEEAKTRWIRSLHA